MRVRAAIMIGIAALLPTGLVEAHHSAAMFDNAKTLTLHGTVSDFQWTNPHCWIELYTSDPGAPAKWSIEGTSPSSMSRSGWKHASIKTGDKITVVIHPKRDGGAVGSLISATLADGHNLTMAN